MAGNETINALRQALQFSPDNVPLRQHLAETLLSYNRPEEAEREFRQAIPLAPNVIELKVGLATAFYQQGKQSEAAVIVEEIVRDPMAPAKAHLLYARLMFRAGNVPDAVKHYKQAVASNAGLADEELAEHLGIRTRMDEDPAEKSDENADVIDGQIRVREEGDISSVISVEKPSVSFRDIGGMDSVKDEIRLKIIHPLAHPELYEAYGKTIGGGILMYGPPGCGKTHLARATAGEIRATFISVGIADVLDMYLGKSEQNLRELFERARHSRPCVLFFDEVDALAASRSDLRHNWSRMVINQFLAELDGLQGSNEGVLVLAATNAPWHLDNAFRRPGRFDRILFIPPPDAAARESILRIMLRGKPIGDIDYAYLAKKTEGFSGADLKGLVDLAIEGKLREAMKAGVPKPILTRDLMNAAGSMKPSTREWFSTARNYALYSNQGGTYDDVLKYLKL